MEEIEFRINATLNEISFNITKVVGMLSEELTRPSVLFKPKIYMDGNSWCALYGDNLQDGVCAFGRTPDEAMRNFDTEWALER